MISIKRRRQIKFIITLSIILLIIIGDILTHKFTTKTVAEISREIFLLTESVKNNKDDIQQKLYNIEKAWEKYSEKLAYYIEHDEIEKIDTAFIKVKSFVENDDIPSAVAELETSKFVLEHIEKKYKFNLQNIF